MSSRAVLCRHSAGDQPGHTGIGPQLHFFGHEQIDERDPGQAAVLGHGSRAFVEDGHLPALFRQEERRLAAGDAAAHHQHPVAHPVQLLIDLRDLQGARLFPAGQLVRPGPGARRQNDRLGRQGRHRLRGRLRTEADLNIRLATDGLLQIINVFRGVRPERPGEGPADVAAQLWHPLQQRDGVPLPGGGQRRRHARRAAAHHHNVHGHLRLRPALVEPELPESRGIHRAAAAPGPGHLV